MTDAIDIHTVRIFAGPDVRDWPATAAITRVIFLWNNFQIEHTKQNGPGRWPDVQPPGWDGPIQWTLWPLVQVDGEWRTTAALEFWHDGKHGRYDGVGGPYSAGAANWWYHVGAMASVQPGPGQQAGFMVTSAVTRNSSDVSWNPTHERSNIVLVNVPALDTGVFDFTTEQPPAPTPTPEPNPTPPPSGDLAEVLARLAHLQTDIDGLKESAGVVALQVSQRLDEIKQRQDRSYSGRVLRSTITLTPDEKRAIDRGTKS